MCCATIVRFAFGVSRYVGDSIKNKGSYAIATSVVVVVVVVANQ